MNKKVITGIVIVLVILAAWWVNSAKKVEAPGDDVVTNEYTQELDGLNAVDLEVDLQAIDVNLEKL